MGITSEQESGFDAEMSFESALENYLNPDFGDLEEGSIVKGEIVRIDDDNILVDVNFKSEGQIPISEFTDLEGNVNVKVTHVTQMREVLISHLSNRNIANVDLALTYQVQ